MFTRYHRIMSLVIVLFCFLLLYPWNVHAADRRYVSDILIVTLRQGKGTGTKIKNLKTNTPVDVLEQSGNYLRVRTEGGLVGWVHGQYISQETPKPVVIRQLQKQVDKLQASVNELGKDQPEILSELRDAQSRHAAEVKQLESRMNHYREEADRTGKELAAITEKYNTLTSHSENLTELLDENEHLKKELGRLKRDIGFLRDASSKPRPPAMLWWFFGGAVVFFGGLIVGTIMKKKKYYLDI